MSFFGNKALSISWRLAINIFVYKAFLVSIVNIATDTNWLFLISLA